MANIHYDAPRPGHPGSIDFTNTDQVVQNWRNAIQADQNLGKEMVGDVKTYKGQIAPARAALKNSIKTNWKANNERFVASVKDVIREIKTPVTSNMETVPETLISDAQAAKMERVMDKIHIAAKNDLAFGNQVAGDLTQFKNSTAAARNQLKQEARGWKAEGKQVRAGYKHAFEFDVAQIHYDAPRPGHPGSIDFSNTDQVVQNWRNAIQADQDLGNEIKSDVHTYKAQIAPARANLKNSINTQWKAKYQTYINSVKDVIREVQTPVQAQIEGDAPENLMTDAQADKWHRVMERIQAAAKAEIDLINEVQGDVEQFAQDTQPARAKLANEAKVWKAEKAQVREGYKQAFEYDVAQIHYDAPRPGHPGSIDFTNTDQVIQNWRNAIQADQDVNAQIKEDVRNYEVEITPAKQQLKNQINTNWRAKAAVYKQAVRNIVAEIKAPAQV